MMRPSTYALIFTFWFIPSLPHSVYYFSLFLLPSTSVDISPHCYLNFILSSCTVQGSRVKRPWTIQSWILVPLLPPFKLFDFGQVFQSSWVEILQLAQLIFLWSHSSVSLLHPLQGKHGLVTCLSRWKWHMSLLGRSFNQCVIHHIPFCLPPPSCMQRWSLPQTRSWREDGIEQSPNSPAVDT